MSSGRKILILFLAGFLLIPFFFARAEETRMNIYFFWANGCPHCKKEKAYLDKISKEHEDLKIIDFEVTGNDENFELLKKIGKKLKIEISGIPFTIVGDQYMAGWYDENSSGIFLEKLIANARENKCEDVAGNLLLATNLEKNESSCQEVVNGEGLPESMKLPLFGEIKIKNLSLPVLTIAIGALDGFNPCAMWVLLFLISLLLGMRDKKRMWILGFSFIFTSAFVYFLFMSAWLNLFLFLGLILWVRIIIGAVALFSGGYNLKDYYTNKEGVCKITGGEKKKLVFERLKSVAQNQKFWFALGGIIILAFAVNLVELICSAGLPAVYTNILALTNIPKWQYYLYLALYIFVFMLDDLFIFFMAMITLQIAGASGKYSRFSRLIGGLIMIIIGILILFKPAWLIFG